MLNDIHGGERVGRAGDLVRLNDGHAMIASVECIDRPGNAVAQLYRYRLTGGTVLNARVLMPTDHSPTADTFLTLDGSWHAVSAVLID
jgi:hypothetical protein